MEISMSVPYKEIQQNLIATSEEYVKRIWSNRRDECLMAAGEILEEEGYLPYGTKYEAWNNQLWFSIDKGTGTDLAHYFHEGIIYGPNFPIFSTDENGNKTLVGFRSPKGMPKEPTKKSLDQGPFKPAGERHWTEAFNDKKGYMYRMLCERVADILRR